jgi:transposase InsO family protein
MDFPMAERTAWRLCNQSSITSAIVKTRKRRGKKPGSAVCDDLVNRNFTAGGPNQLWLVDITEHRTRGGKLNLCAVKDVFSRRIFAYSIADQMKTRLAVDALHNAFARRGRVTA